HAPAARNGAARLADEHHGDVLLAVVAAAQLVGPHDERVVEHRAVALGDGVELRGQAADAARVVAVHQHHAVRVLGAAPAVGGVEVGHLAVALPVDAFAGSAPL